MLPALNTPPTGPTYSGLSDNSKVSFCACNSAGNGVNEKYPMEFKSISLAAWPVNAPITANMVASLYVFLNNIILNLLQPHRIICKG